MAHKLMHPIGSFRYNNRMMKAGDPPVSMSGPDQRLYTALGVVSATKPKGTNNILSNEIVYGGSEETPKASAAPNKAPAKRKAPAKKKAAPKK